MSSGFERVLVTSGSQALADVEKINEEAFPENERKSIEELLSLSALFSGNRVEALYEGETCIGFYHLVELDTFVYMAFFAISSERRGQGYGTKIMQAMHERFPNKPMLGEVEYPFEDAQNYEQRIKRIRFYERNAMPVINATIDDGEGEKYYIISSKPDAPLDDYMAFMNKISQATGNSASQWHLERE